MVIGDVKTSGCARGPVDWEVGERGGGAVHLEEVLVASVSSCDGGEFSELILS